MDQSRTRLAAAKSAILEIVRAAFRPTEPPHEDEDWRRFRDVLIGLRYIKQSDLIEAGIIPDTSTAWHDFQRRPEDFFMTLPPHLARKLFELAKAAA